MSNKNTFTDPTFPQEDVKEQSKFNLNKFEFDLYHEEDDIAEKVIRVKRFYASVKKEKWKIFEDNKIMFIIEGAKLSNKEKEFFRTVDGVNFLIKQFKNGIKSFNSLKNEIKKVLTP